MEVSVINGYEVKDKKAKRYYNNVQAMKTDTTLKLGMFVETKGYYESNDGGSSIYEIVNEELLVDNGLVHGLTNGLFAKLIIKNNTINVKQFGAKGDNVTDDTISLKNCFNSAKDNENICSVYFPGGEYLVTDTILDEGINGLNIVGSNRDYNSDLSSTIIRDGDFTILNCSGNCTLTELNLTTRMNIEKIYFTDKDNSIAHTNSAIKFYYCMYYTIRDCLFGNRDLSITLRQMYDSRFINCDFTTGGNQTNNSPLLNIDGGRHASLTEIGWDNTNWIVFDSCRFERYRGTAIQTTTYEQPENRNPNFDPCKGTGVNKIYLDKCKFESPYLNTKPVIDIKDSGIIYTNIEVVALDGQPNLEEVINLYNVSELFGYMSIKYYQATIDPNVTFSNFSNPMIKMEKCQRIDLSLLPGTISSYYQLDYLIDFIANDGSYRTINITLPYSYRNKKITNNENDLNIGYQGFKTTYGLNGNNGLRFKNEVDDDDDWRISTFTNGTKNEIRYRYKKGNNATQYPFLLSADNNEITNISNADLLINKNLKISSSLNVPTSSSRTERIIAYSDSLPNSGYWIKGDIIFNNNPISGGYIGWVNLTNGTSPTWKGFGSIES